MKDETYQGWTNRETWALNLWLTNEQGTAEQLRYIANSPELEGWERAEYLEGWIDNENPLAEECTMWADLMNACLYRVNWEEIIENHTEEN